MTLSPEEAAHMLNAGLVGVNVYQMQKIGPNRPKMRDLISRGLVRYNRIDPNEHWQTYGQILGQIARKGYADADCEDLASAVAAEMRLEPPDSPMYDPQATTHVYRSAPRTSHVVVWSPRFGRLLDPSVAAGMGGPRDRRMMADNRRAASELRQVAGDGDGARWGW